MLAYVLWACLFIQALTAIAILFRFPGFNSAFQRETRYSGLRPFCSHSITPNLLLSYFAVFLPFPSPSPHCFCPFLPACWQTDRRASFSSHPFTFKWGRCFLFSFVPSTRRSNHYQFNRKTVLHSKPGIIFFLFQANSLLFFFFSFPEKGK